MDRIDARQRVLLIELARDLREFQLLIGNHACLREPQHGLFGRDLVHPQSRRTARPFRRDLPAQRRRTLLERAELHRSFLQLRLLEARVELGEYFALRHPAAERAVQTDDPPFGLRRDAMGHVIDLEPGALGRCRDVDARPEQPRDPSERQEERGPKPQRARTLAVERACRVNEAR
jgi:hypothetical protein